MRRLIAPALALVVSTVGLVTAAGPARADVSSTLSGTTVDGPTYDRVASAGSTTPAKPTALDINATATHFRAIAFTVETAGTYSFVQSSPTSGNAGTGASPYDGFATLYQDGFDPTKPVSNAVIDSDDTSPSDRQPSFPSVPLSTGTYVYVAAGYNNTTEGAFSVAVSGPDQVSPDPAPSASVTITNGVSSGTKDVSAAGSSESDAVGGYRGYLFDDATGALLASGTTPTGSRTLTLTLTDSSDDLRLVLAEVTASGTRAWTPVLYPLPDGAPTLSVSPVNAVSFSSSTSFDTGTRPTLAVGEVLQLDSASDDVSIPGYLDSGQSEIFGDVVPGTTYEATAYLSTGLELDPRVSAPGHLALPALAPLGAVTIASTSPTDSSTIEGHTAGTLHWQAVTFDVVTPGDYLIAGVSTTTPAWDDVLILHQGDFDPAATTDTYLSYSDDEGRKDRNLIAKSLTAGRYVAVVQGYSPTQTGATSIYVTGPAPVIGSAPGAPSEPTVIGATPGNHTAVVTLAPPSYDQGSPVTADTVVLTPPSGPAVTATGTSPLTVHGLTDGVTYSVRAAAINARGTGPLSLTGPSVTPAAIAPGAPTALSAQATGPTTARVSFGAAATTGTDSVTGYQVALVSSKGTRVVSTTGPGALTVSGLTPGVSYAVSVVATSIAGTGTPATATIATPKVSISLSRKGRTLTVTAKLAGKALAKGKVELLARKKGSRSWRKVTTRTTSGKGKATFTITPVKGTSYEAELIISVPVVTSKVLKI